MRHSVSKIFFDQRDYELLNIVNDVLNRDESFSYLKSLLYPYLHPRGIKEMAATKGLRVAYAVVHLLGSLEAGKGDDRLSALRSLHDEVLNGTDSILQRNTARVLLQIMKDMVRCRHDYLRQLELAHDFRVATSGKPRVIRSFLRRYHLLEMPEEWNQVAFDDHVHDSNTKGRKSPTHLIMDAWIKGIRQLTVIYYNYVRPKTAAELLEASEIMGIHVRIGVELSSRFRNGYVQLIWVPRGFLDAKDFLHFLADEPVTRFMTEGRKVSQYQQLYVLQLLHEFNERHRQAISEAFGFHLAPLEEAGFRAFVAMGQPSILHLAKYIHVQMLPAMQARVADLRGRYDQMSEDERRSARELTEEMDRLDSEAIIERYLRPACNPSIPDPHIPQVGPDVPDLLMSTPDALINRLNQLHTGHRVTLNLSKLKVEDVLELLYECKGSITHLELFNLKDYTFGKTEHIREINELQRAINEGNVISLKRMIRGIIQRIEASDDEEKADRVEKLKEILHNIANLQSYYRRAPLKARIGSDSTGHSPRMYGMGLAVRETLPRRTQRELRRGSGPTRLTIPVHVVAYLRATYVRRDGPSPFANALYRWASLVPGLRLVGQERLEEWEVEDSSTHMEKTGNIVTLGGIRKETGNGLSLDAPKRRVDEHRLSWSYLNTGLRNGLKVLIGFVPAFFSFALTKEWWLLAYFGAFIWFGITGLRNILQSVLGAGGIRRSPALRWNDYVSWDRLTDSLLYTGFSVPLLDYLVKTVLLDRTFGITTATNPYLLYTAMAIANGVYISSHNAFRGLQKGAMLVNSFRSILSIPLAIGFNALVGGILYESGVPDVSAVLQKWAAIISKAASDCVAGVIEGVADRFTNIRIRSRDYGTKLDQLFDTYARLELLFPEADVLKMLESPKKLIRAITNEARDLEKIMIINALDLLYFWMYQPRSRGVLCSFLKGMSQEERQIFVRSQFILQRHREITQLFVDGIVGRKFSRALSFYLDRSGEYLEALKEMAYDPAHCASVDGERLSVNGRAGGPPPRRLENDEMDDATAAANGSAPV